MKFRLNLRTLLVLLLVANVRAEAQVFFGVGVKTSANSILVSNALTYTISVTNPGVVPAPQALVSNTLPASVQFLSATNSQGSFTNYGNTIVFDLGFVFTSAEMSLRVQPNAVGLITNRITVTATNSALVIFPVTTNVVTQVTNFVPTQVNLGVTMTGPAQKVIVNDWMTYGVTATNSGPSAAPNVMLTNTLPPGVILLRVAPANQPYTVVTNNLIFNLGTLTNGAGTNLQFTVQPTNGGTLNFSASIGAAGVVDVNPTNNVASTNVPVINYLSGPLLAVTNSAQLLNLQNGLTEQSVRVSNDSGTNAVAVRLVVTNLTRQLFNAVGTNNGNPFVVLNTGLPSGDNVNFLLQFSPRGSFPLANSQLQAFAVPLLNLTPPAPTSTSGLLNISRLVPLTNGNVLIEFPSIIGRRYTVVYSDNVSFSNAMIAPPSILAPASRTQWIDYGPPATTGTPANATNRFYRVFLNQ
jgi:uncharacterized repeat protein (TIGR01451 family)